MGFFFLEAQGAKDHSAVCEKLIELKPVYKSVDIDVQFWANDGFEDVEYIAWCLGQMTGEPLNYVWDNRDIYDYNRILTYKHFRDYCEGERIRKQSGE